MGWVRNCAEILSKPLFLDRWVVGELGAGLVGVLGAGWVVLGAGCWVAKVRNCTEMLHQAINAPGCCPKKAPIYSKDGLDWKRGTRSDGDDGDCADEHDNDGDGGGDDGDDGGSRCN